MKLVSISVLVTNKKKKLYSEFCRATLFYFLPRLHFSPGMFYLRFIGAVRFHKSWNAPTAKYSCPQLHHNYYALYPLRALSLVIVVLSSDITCSQEYILHYVRYICLHFRRTCLFEISNHDPSSLIKFDGIDSMIWSD